ncbi:MAG: hypothetical protein JKX94_07740 [Sneathiella sp.]|nr:hypothetical protein [Sneathiella sp.]
MSSTTASAVKYDFTTEDRDATEGALNYEVEGLNLDVFSARYTGSEVEGYGDIAQSEGDGLYIEYGHKEKHQIDRYGADEVVKFNFSEEITLSEIKFSFFDAGDKFDFFFDIDI